MVKDIPLGRLAGIKVGMDPTVVLLAVLCTFLLAERQLPLLQPDASNTAYWVAGGFGAMLLFLSLLAHELGHALVARDEGIGVTSMGLTIYGGVTRMETTPTTPGAEFRVAVVGPIASAACGVIFLMGAVLLPDDGVVGLISDVFIWIGYVNLILAVANMIPAAPLDGGKVLSSAIWRTTGSQATAMIWVAAVGIVAGMAFVAYGLREFLDSGGLFGIYILAIGAFVAYGAFTQMRSAPIIRALDGYRVTDAMVAEPPAAPGWTTIDEFLRSATPTPEQQAFPVIGPDGQVSGLLTSAAIRAVPPERWATLAVGDLAYPLERVRLVHTDELLLPALQKLEGSDVRIGLVVSGDGRIAGTLDGRSLDRILAMRQAGLEPARA